MGSVLLILLIKCTIGAVLGIDFGSEYIKVAIVAPGAPFKIVLDEMSKRKIPSVVAFDSDIRQYGNGATSLLTKRPHDSYRYISRLMGKSIESPEVAELLNLHALPYELEEHPRRKSIRIKRGDGYLEVEEVMAMILSYVKRIAEAENNDRPVMDAVVTVPMSWSQQERKAFMDSAKLAGLNILSLLNENTAAALTYGIEREYNETKAHNYILFNMGSSSTKVSVLRYSAYRGKRNRTIGQVEILGVAWDEFIGGNRFDGIIVENLIEAVKAHKDIKKEGLTDVRAEPRVMARLKKAARKAKEVLNTIKEYTVHIEGVYKDYDLRGHKLSRDEFDEKCEDLYKSVLVPIEDAVRQSGLTKEDFEGIILMGGGSRLIGVQDRLQSYLPDKDLKKDLSTDEASVMGAAFTAANVSISFKVRPIGLVDVTPFAVGVRVTNLSPEDDTFDKQGKIFKRYNKLSSVKTMRFSYDRDFRVEINYLASENPPYLPEGISNKIGSWAITGVQKVVDQMREAGIEGKPKMYLTLKLDKNSIITISKARGEYSESYEVVVEEKKPKVSKDKKDAADKVKDTNDEAKDPKEKADAADKEEDEAEKSKDAKEKADAADKEKAEEKISEKEDAEKKDDSDKTAEKKEGTDKAKSNETDDKDKTPPKMVPEIRTRTKKVSLNVTYEGSDVLSFTEADFNTSLKKLKDMDLKDVAVHENAAAKNKLESFIYEVRGIFGDEEETIAKVATEEQIEEAMRDVQEAEDWLWEVEPEEESAKLFKDKLKATRSKTDAILNRALELEQRPKAIKTALANIESGKAALLKIKNRTAITDAERTKLSSQIETAEKWIMEKIEMQEKLTLVEKPAFKSAELLKRSESFKKFQTQLVKRPEPKKKKKKKKKKKASNDTSTGEGDNSTVTKSDNETVSDDKDFGDDDEDSDSKDEIKGDDEDKDEL